MHVLGFWSEYTKLNNLCGVVATGTGTCMLPFLVYGGGGGGVGYLCCWGENLLRSGVWYG